MQSAAFSSPIKTTDHYWAIGSKIDDNVKPCGSSENLKSVWHQYKPKLCGHGFNNVCSKTSSKNKSFLEPCKAKKNWYGFNNVSFNNLSRTIIAHSMNHNNSNTSYDYDYYGPNTSKEKSLPENKVLPISKPTNVDNRTNSKSFNAKPNTTLERDESCLRIESEVAVENLSQNKSRAFRIQGE